ncbi:MAG: prepilin peptidase [Pseudomonadota bacterium]|nr:prepilin peptidase [Pseudomonadota bacterium]
MPQPALLTAGALAALLSGWLAVRLAEMPQGQRRILRGAFVLAPAAVAAALLLAGLDALLALAIACALPFGVGAVALDWREGAIADGHSTGLAVTGLLAAPVLHPYATWTLALGGAALAAGILLFGDVLVRLRTRKPGLGTGDYGLAAAGGLWCGLGWVGPALLAAIAVTLVLALAGGRELRGKLAFAPGLVAGFAMATIAGRLV